MNIGSVFRQSKWSMKRKLFGYMMLLAGLLVVVLISCFVLLGRFDSQKKNTFTELDIQMEFLERNVFTHFDRLAGGGTRLSGDMSLVIDRFLLEQGLSFAQLSQNEAALSALQRELLDPLAIHLRQENCSGAFLMLNATLSSAPPDVSASRTGLYIQRSSYYNSDETLVLYRGDSAVGKEAGILPHRKWGLEIQTDLIPDYAQILENAALPLQTSYLYTPVFNLPGTSDQVMLLVLPMFGADGTLYGLCGYEISENYFMSYHAQPTKIPNLTCLVAPGNSETLDSSRSLSCGGANGYYRMPAGVLIPSDMGGGLTCFTSADVSYVGLTQRISLSPNNPDHVLAVMMLKSDYDSALRKHALQNFFLWSLLLFFAVTSCLYLSKRFVSPILGALDQLKAQNRPVRSDVPEMDDLFHFLSRKDIEQEQVIRSLEQTRLAALHEKEILRMEYEAALSRFETAQMEISRLAYARSQEVDPDDYAQFLAGLGTLTVTERKVYDYYLEGKTVREITELSNIKESTLRFHNRNIYSKLGVNSLKQLLRYAAMMQQEGEPVKDAPPRMTLFRTEGIFRPFFIFCVILSRKRTPETGIL